MILSQVVAFLALSQVAFCNLVKPVNPLLVQEFDLQYVEIDPVPSQILELHLSDISAFEFSTLRHPLYPNHHVRIKETQGFCDPIVKAYTGFIEIEHGRKHLFFYFFESRRDPDNDDLMLWISGGPGASGAVGLFGVIGPCKIDPTTTNGTSWNPWSWNRHSNLLFLDQPIDVGFSYGDKVPLPATAQTAAKDVHAFLTIWFETFIKFKGRPFHMAGASYGGRYVPVFASHVWDRNQLAEAEGRTPINLQSIVLQNGWTDPALIFSGYYEMLCMNSSVTPFLPIETCAELVYTVPECYKRFSQSCGRSYNTLDCRAAANYCEVELMNRFYLSGRSVYDISKKCDDDQGVACYPEVSRIPDYLNKNETKDMLGVPRDYQFNLISYTLHEAFVLAGDMYQPTGSYLVGLLERGIRILVYAGTNDLTCNFVGNYRTVQGLDWTGGKEFRDKDLRNWKVEGHVAGETKTHGRLTWATVRGAGHIAPLDKPVEAAHLWESWLAGTEL